MSVNKVDAGDGRLNLQGDYVVHHEKNITFGLEGDRLPANLKGSHSGDIFITNLRLIYVNKGSNGYKTFSMDFKSIRNTEVKQPIFGSNHIRGFVRSEANGGWEGNANFKIDFPKGGAIEFAEKFEKAVKESLRFGQNGFAPPPPMQPTYGGYYPPPQQQPMMAPPPMGAGGFYPPPQPGYYQYQSAPPPAGYQPPPQNYGQPPPPNYGQPPPNQAPPPYQSNATTTDSAMHHPKAQEAYRSGNTAYIPNDAPPPYNPEYKKDQ